MKKLILLSFMLMLSVMAHAESSGGGSLSYQELVERARSDYQKKVEVILSLPPPETSQKILSDLISSGHRNLGALDLVQARDGMKSIRWLALGEQGVAVGSGAARRGSAVNLTEEKAVLINIPMIASGNRVSKEQLEILYLHEGLGAQGYDDEEYQISTVLYLLNQGANIDSSYFDKEFKKTSKPRATNRVYRNEDGGTSVGGGGDINSLGINTQVVEKIYSKASKDRSSVGRANKILKKVLQVEFFLDDSLNVKAEPFVLSKKWGKISVQLRHIPLAMLSDAEYNSMVDDLANAIERAL